MNYETWVAKRNTGTAGSARAMARSAARRAVIEVFEVFPEEWFDGFALSRFLDFPIPYGMLGDLARKEIVIKKQYVPGSRTPLLYKFNSNKELTS